jgi:BirA family biotin operon repressor/biotin-[acetyl-CoA-carboxylase] ligase
VSVLAVDGPVEAGALARAVEAIETRYRGSTTNVLADYLRRCETIGQTVCARMIPLGPGGVQFTGRAVSVLMDGGLVLEIEEGRRVVLRPQSLGQLERL